MPPPSTPVWPRYPTLYEINTWVWLYELGQKYRRPVTLSSVPQLEWDAIAGYGFDAVWLMGVWERSPAGLAIANQNNGLLNDFRRALPDFRSEDNVGSPYCVRRYTVDSHLGGQEGLAIARMELAQRGMSLILDFVPNHVAPDHPWVAEHPEYFIRGTVEDALNDAAAYLRVLGNVYARGRDPYFPPWPDVLQLNAFDLGLRQAAVETVSTIAQQCDGIRCDMAMLFLNTVFERTWGRQAGQQLATEYWSDVIPSVKGMYPGFLFIAEAYWDLEWELQQLGFDFCYDKKLYDRFEHGNAESIRLHLCADLAYQSKLVRFIENHDEPRAAVAFSKTKQKAFALMTATLPGIRLFHEGQFEGRKTRLPVFLRRRHDEAVDHDLQRFYARLLKAIDHPTFREGCWTLCEQTGWPDNASFQNIVAWNWQKGHDDERFLIVVNLSDRPAQARVKVPWADAGGEVWQLADLLSDAKYDRDGDEMHSPGLYVELGAFDSHLFRCLRTEKT